MESEISRGRDHIARFTYSSGVYNPPAGSHMRLTADTPNSRFILEDPPPANSGCSTTSISRCPIPATAACWSGRGAAWRDAGKQGAIFSLDADGYVTQVTSAEGQDYNLVFTYSDYRLTKIEVRTGAGPPPGEGSRVRVFRLRPAAATTRPMSARTVI